MGTLLSSENLHCPVVFIKILSLSTPWSGRVVEIFSPSGRRVFGESEGSHIVVPLSRESV